MDDIGCTYFFASQKSQLIINDNFKKNISLIFPQGWGFFTKNPRDLVLEIYIIKNKKLYYIDVSNLSLKNKFGFSRSSRVIGYELSTIASKIQKNEWKESTNKDINNHINDKAIILQNNATFNYLKKGEYLIKAFKPIPYAWSKSKQEKFNPISVVKIKMI